MIEKYLAAKKAMEEAKQLLAEAEKSLIDSMGKLKLEGTTSSKVDGYKITVTTKLKRKLDHEAYKLLGLPENLQFVKYPPEIDLTKLRHIEAVDPAIVAMCVTIEPAKTSIKVEAINGNL